MLAEKAHLDTITNGLDVIVPIKSRTGTLNTNANTINTCSVATEAFALESRDADVSERRGVDGERDVTASAVDAPLPSNEVVAVTGGSGSGSSSCAYSFLEYFYSTIEVGASVVFCTSKEKNTSHPPGTPSAMDILGSSHDEASGALADEKEKGIAQTVEKAKSQETVKTQRPCIDIIKQQGSNVSAMTQGTLLKAENGKRSGCGIISAFGCAGGEQINEVDSESNQKEGTISNALARVLSDEPHILDTFYDDDTIASDVLTKNESLLNEIKSIENTLVKVQRSATFHNMDDFKTRQDPFYEKVAAFKENLLQQQALLQTAPEETKKEFYNAISASAVLNAEIETRRAELELKKIRLESMRIEQEMDCMMIHDESDTFDTFDNDSGFSALVRYVTGTGKRNDGERAVPE